MNRRHNDIKTMQIASILTLIIGIIGDDYSTTIGLSTGKFNESNRFVSNLMANGTWIIWDIMLILSITTMITILPQLVKKQNAAPLMIFFLLAGAIRITACLSNLYLIKIFG
jgi:hypothetical protein